MWQLRTDFVIRNNIYDRLFVLKKIYNANNELDQVKALIDLDEIFDCVGDIQNKNIIFDGYFNIDFDSFVEAQRGKPILKKHTLAKIIQIEEKLNLTDIWRI